MRSAEENKMRHVVEEIKGETEVRNRKGRSRRGRNDKNENEQWEKRHETVLEQRIRRACRKTEKKQIKVIGKDRI